MTPQRRDELLRGVTSIAQKVYLAVTDSKTNSNTVMEVAVSMKTQTGSAADVHTLRGCLNALVKAGLVREIVPGSFRRVHVREIEEPIAMPEPKTKTATITSSKPSAEPLDRLGDVAAQVRTTASSLRSLASGMDALAGDIETTAIAIEERGVASAEELGKLRQFKALLKELA